jgi:hypothetical protein
MKLEIFNQINIKARNTCQEADKVTSNWSIKRIMRQRQPRWCFDKCMVINSCYNAWIINSFYFGYRSPIRSYPTTKQLYRSDPKWIFWFRNPNESDRIGSDLHTSTSYNSPFFTVVIHDVNCNAVTLVPGENGEPLVTSIANPTSTLD